MKFTKKLVSALTALAMALPCGLSVQAADLSAAQIQAEAAAMPSRDDASDEIKHAGSRLIYDYGNGDADSVSQDLETLRTLSEDDWYPLYQKTIDTWTEIETEMPENTGVAPDGIEHPENHCFIVLGYALNADGTMTDELVGRLETAKASLDKYPQAKVLVTGGVEKNGWTEGKRMHDWLMANGISEDRIYVENKAPDTTGNATNSFAILYNDPQIKTVSLISSQYHIKRGSILYYAESLLKARELGCEPIEFLTDFNAGWLREDKTSEPMTSKVNSLYSIFRVPKVEPPVLSDDTVLTGLDLIDTTSRGFARKQGEPLAMMVKTLDTKNDNLDVTDWCTYSPYDPDKTGVQTVTVSFTYGDKTVTASVDVTVSPAEDTAAAYRLYNPNSGEHFFTLEAKERDYLKEAGWKDEGQGWNTPAVSDTPVYRLYNPNAGDHHYTADAKEKDALVALGWNDEGISWYSADQSGTPIYRLYNPNAKAGAHHFTLDRQESDYLANAGWNAEDVAWYALAN